MLRRLGVLLVVLMAAAACGDSAATTAPATTAAPVTSATTSPPPTTTTVPPTTTTVPPTTVAPTTTPPGEPFDLYVPQPGEGAILGVVGVQFDDTLNVRSGPGIGNSVVFELDPTADGITGTGNGWVLPSGSLWWEIETGSGTGWANSRFLSRLGGVDDLTSLVVSSYGEIPAAETMLDLGLIVANELGSDDEEAQSDITVVVAPTVGDLGEITIDVIGLLDDSVRGYRLHIFGQPDEGGEGFSLMAVETTFLCDRGVSDGLCA